MAVILVLVHDNKYWRQLLLVYVGRDLIFLTCDTQHLCTLYSVLLGSIGRWCGRTHLFSINPYVCVRAPFVSDVSAHWLRLQ